MATKPSDPSVRATKHITREQYDALVEGFRARPGSISAVARAVGVAYTTAFRYWHRGGVYEWAKPIQPIIEGEQEAARALLQEEADAIRDARVSEAEARGRALGRADAITAREDKRESLRREARIVRQSRQNAEAFLEVAATLLGATAEIRDHVLDAIRTGKLRDAIVRDPAVGLALLRELSRIIADAQTVARTAVELEHLTLGDPRSQGTSSVEITTSDEAIVIIRRAAAAVQRSRGLRALPEPDEPERDAIEVEPLPRGREAG